MKYFGVLLLAGAVSFSVAHGQTYLTKAVRFEGVDAYQKADLLKVAGLRDSGSFTKAELDAAVQKLADTGLFAGTAYKIDATALVITLAPVEPGQLQPVRFSNFVWWTPEQLESGLRSRVPLYAGRVPLNGDMLERLEKALVAMMAEKGIAAKVDQITSSESMGGAITATTLGLTTPEVKVGTLHLAGSSTTSAELERVQAVLGGQDYDERSTRKALVATTVEMYRDDGYLDAAVEAAEHGEPKAAGLARYEVDLNGTLTGDALYHVSAIQAKAAAPITQAEVDSGLQIRKGDVASARLLHVAESRLKFAYQDRGYEDASVTTNVQKDQVAHTAAYTMMFTPGEVYHVASVNTAGFSPEQQKEFEHTVHVTAGAVFDRGVRLQLAELSHKKAFQGSKMRTGMRKDKTQHSITLTLSIGQTE